MGSKNIELKKIIFRRFNLKNNSWRAQTKKYYTYEIIEKCGYRPVTNRVRTMLNINQLKVILIIIFNEHLSQNKKVYVALVRHKLFFIFLKMF